MAQVIQKKQSPTLEELQSLTHPHPIVLRAWGESVASIAEICEVEPATVYSWQYRRYEPKRPSRKLAGQKLQELAGKQVTEPKWLEFLDN